MQFCCSLHWWLIATCSYSAVKPPTGCLGSPCTIRQRQIKFLRRNVYNCIQRLLIRRREIFYVSCFLVYDTRRYYITVVKVIWHKTASPPQTDDSVVFARWRQCIHMGGYIGATWRIWLNLCFLRPTRVHNPNCKSIGSAVSAQLTAESPYTLQWATLSPIIAPSRGGSWRHLIHDSLSRTEPTIQTASRSVQLFSHRWPQSVPILYNGTPLSPQNWPFPWGSGPHLSLGQPESSTQMASRSVQPF